MVHCHSTDNNCVLFCYWYCIPSHLRVRVFCHLSYSPIATSSYQIKSYTIKPYRIWFRSWRVCWCYLLWYTHFCGVHPPIFEAPTHVFVAVVKTTSHELWRHHNFLMSPSSLIIRVFNSTMSAWCTFATAHLHAISPFPSDVIRDIVNMAKCLSTTCFSSSQFLWQLCCFCVQILP